LQYSTVNRTMLLIIIDMTNVSKRKLPEKDFNKLFKQLNNIVGSLSKSSSEIFFNNLLGPEERVMLTKRLAAVVMFIEGNSSYRVWQLLKISPSTAESIRRDFESGRYSDIVKIITKNKKGYENFWLTLEVILRAGIPPRGRDRWKSLFKN